MKPYFLSIAFLAFFSSGFAWADVDINTATAQQMADELANIGPAKAAAIVEYRQTNGRFQSVEDLMKVNGIGYATLEMNREVLMVSDRPAASPNSQNMGTPDNMTDVAATRKGGDQQEQR